MTTDRRWNATDVDTETTIVLQGDDGSATSLRVGFGADFSWGQRVGGFFDYLGDFGDDDETHTFIAGLRVDL